MVFDRPNRSGQSRPNPATQRNPIERPNQSVESKTGKPKKVLPDVKGGGGNRGGNGGNGGGGNGGNLPSESSPWLNPDQPPENFDSSASFVEYLRWMRSPDSAHKYPTKVQILQMAVEGADYQKRLECLNQRTKLISGAGNWFEVNAPWRIRVGGHKGPESILLPAFDALGMPYIPSATLRGVARNQAIREFLDNDSSLDWKGAEKKVAPYFGSLDVEGGDRSGKVVFLDAYPTPSEAGGLAMDMANAIWSWENGEPKYSPNPNPFLSLEKSSFIIGLCKTASCTDEILAKVRQWLETGLAEGVGSQVNTGYGRLMAEKTVRSSGFFEVDFTIQGQLIHGHQKFANLNEPYKPNRRGELKPATINHAEVRPTAFKSMLRYWFRSFALGVLPVDTVKEFEAEIFGSITPQTHGWIRFEVMNGKIVQKESRVTRDGKNDPHGEQSGTLVFMHSSEIPKDRQKVTIDLLKNLTWLMFHLGGIGQGARRPLYSRENRSNAPWWRGCDLIAESEDDFWSLPDSVNEFQLLFQQRLRSFYEALQELTQTEIKPQMLLSIGPVSQIKWHEAIDRHCKIIICTGEEDFGKPYSLAVLHDGLLKRTKRDRQGNAILNNGEEIREYDPDLCGTTQANPAKPSPVWIANLGQYQVVTVFGADRNPRQEYVKQLRDRTSATSFAQIFPLI